MNTSQPNRRWKLIAAAVLSAIIATMFFACFFPWLALLTGLALLAGGIAHAAWPPISEKLASLRSLPCPSLQSRIYIGVPIAVFGLVLLALAQSQIRANWRTADIRAEVAKEIEQANSALDQERVDEALEICVQLDARANAEEKTQVAAIRARAQSIENSRRKKAANVEVVRLVSDGRLQIMKRDLAAAQSTLERALSVPMATEFDRATAFANEIVAAHRKLATGLFDDGEFAEAKKHIELAIRVPSATDVAEAKRLYVDICNREVAQFVASARASLAENKRDEAAAALESALAIRDATDTADADKMLAAIREAREAEANARVSTLMAEAQRSLDAKLFDDAIRTLDSALAVPHTTQKTQVTAALQLAQKQKAAERERAIALEAARKAKEEYEQNGLVLLRKTLQGKSGELTGEITGTVINRRNRKLRYAQISFNLYDDSGAQVGTALANVNGLEPGGKWKFKATAFGTDFSTYKVNELTGF